MMRNRNGSFLRLALPSKGELEKPTLNLLAAAGLSVFRPNERQYVASIPSAPQIDVLFQRAADILAKVDEGSVDLGITGFDIVCERGEGYDNMLMMCENLGYGKCELVLAVPEGWVDVSSIEDLADLMMHRKENGQDLRIATKYPNSTRKWLYEKRIIHFSLVEAQGALEAAPSMGYADMIADITTSGTTLRENRLKKISSGTILSSQACLIGNKKLLQEDPDKLHTAMIVLELLEAHLRAKSFFSITANIRGESPEAIAQRLVRVREQERERAMAGLRGPSIAKVYSKFWGQDDWYAVTIVVEQKMLLEAIDHLRKAGGTDITVFSVNYLFDAKSWNYEGFIEKLNRERL